MESKSLFDKSLDVTRKILIVDDDEDEFYMVRTMLEEARGQAFDVYWAATYEASREALLEDHYDAVLVDYDLGGRSGIDLIREANERGYSAPLILFTGYGSYQVDVAAMQGGATLFLSKDEVNPLLLERTIRYAIELKQKERALRQREKELQEQEEVLRLALLAGNAGAWSWDLTNNRIYWSDEYYRLFGYEPGSVTPSVEAGMSHVHPEDRQRINAVIQAAMESGHRIDVVHRVIWPDGTIHWLRGISKATFDSQGKLSRLTGIAIEITEQKQSEEEAVADLRDMHLLHDLSTRLVSENNIQVLYEEVLTAAMTLLHADAGSFQLLKEDTQELIVLAARGFSREMIAHFSRLDAASNTSCGIALAKGTRAFVDFDTPDSPDPDGSRRMHVEAGYRSAQSTPLITRTGKPIAMLSTHWHEHHRPSERELRFLDLLVRQAADLVERAFAEVSLRESEARLQESENRFRVALASAPITVYTTDCDLRITWMHDFHPGFNSESVLGLRMDQVLPIEYGQKIIAIQQSVLTTGEAQQGEIETRLEGKQFFYTYYIEPICETARETIGLACAGYDITMFKQAEIAQREHQIQMETQRRLLDYREQERQMIAREIHDGPVQNLSSLLFNIQTAKGSVTNPAVQSELENIALQLKGSVQYLRQMINEMRPPSLIRFGLVRALEVYLEDIKEKYPLIELSVSLNEESNPLPEQVRFNLFRIAQEALNNAVNHGKASKITIRFEEADHRAILEVTDNGKGFTVSDSLVNYSIQGHFGLIGMKERAETMGGELKIISDPEHGTTIRAIIPLEH